MKLAILLCTLFACCLAGANRFTLEAEGLCEYTSAQCYTCNGTASTSQSLTFVGPKLVSTTTSSVPIGSPMALTINGCITNDSKSFKEDYHFSIESSSLTFHGNGNLYGVAGTGIYTLQNATGMFEGSTGGATAVLIGAQNGQKVTYSLTYTILLVK